MLCEERFRPAKDEDTEYLGRLRLSPLNIFARSDRDEVLTVGRPVYSNSSNSEREPYRLETPSRDIQVASIFCWALVQRERYIVC